MCFAAFTSLVSIIAVIIRRAALLKKKVEDLEVTAGQVESAKQFSVEQTPEGNTKRFTKNYDRLKRGKLQKIIIKSNRICR